jgi:DsbC/DsbD-like thiol-disulfide interchange protein
LLKATVQRATVVPSVSASSVAPGATVSLFVDVTPNPAMHVYAEGAKDVTPVALLITPNAAVTLGAPKYPKAESVPDPASVSPVPAYVRTFRISVPVTVKKSTKSGESVTLGGVVNYQACDDRLCYPMSSAPVSWHVTVK